MFAYLRLDHGADAAQDEAVDALANSRTSGDPHRAVAIFTISARKCSAGRSPPPWPARSSASTRSISPTWKPARSRRASSPTEYEKTGSLPAETPIYSEDGIELFTDEKNAAALGSAAGGDNRWPAICARISNRLSAGDYFALLGYIEMNDAHEDALQSHAPRRPRQEASRPPAWASARASCTPPGRPTRAARTRGVFLQITCDDEADLPVPGQKYTFGVVKAAQARGDFQVLVERDRRALRVHLHDWSAGCRRFNRPSQKRYRRTWRTGWATSDAASKLTRKGDSQCNSA